MFLKNLFCFCPKTSQILCMLKFWYINGNHCGCNFKFLSIFISVLLLILMYREDLPEQVLSLRTCNICMLMHATVFYLFYFHRGEINHSQEIIQIPEDILQVAFTHAAMNDGWAKNASLNGCFVERRELIWKLKSISTDYRIQ